MAHDHQRHLRSLWLLIVIALATPALAQMTSDQQAQMLLSSANRAYNEKNYPFAAARYREFLQRFAAHRDLPQARYGLALCLLEGTERDADKAMEQLSPLLGQKSLSNYPFVLYYAGLARRGQGIRTTDQNQARQRLEESARLFADAASAFFARAREAKAPTRGLAEEMEWALRSRCDQAEMLLRLNKVKEARVAVEGFTSEKTWQESRYFALGLYHHGFASFLVGDHFAAGKSLSRSRVLGDEIFGTHARYLLGRLHHLNTRQNEREEARQAYQTVLRDHEAARKAAPDQLRKGVDPETRARLERLVKGPVPDHVARAGFFLGVLQYEDGRFGDALEHFKTFVTQNASAALVPEARLRIGFCQVQMKQLDEAVKTLTPLAEKEPTMADQALYWIARAQLARVDPKKLDTYKTPIDTFRRAAERAGQRASANPPDLRARGRRGEILAELAETYQLAQQYREAINTYSTILQEKLVPAREEELTLSLATAHQLDGDLAGSDKVCARFIESFKNSTLLPAILFRQAENAALAAVKAEKLPNQSERSRETARHNDEAIKRYSSLVEKYPEYTHVHLARHGLGLAYYRKGDLEKAQKALEAIPAADRAGDLAFVGYSLADIYLRQLPARAEDAVTAGKMEEKLKSASDLLDSFIAAAPDSPQVPDALLKLGYCQLRIATLLAQPADQQTALQRARSAYERVRDKFARHPAYPQAIFEKAKVLIAQKDVNGASNELRRFSSDETLKKSAIAPMALLHLATLQRGQNRPGDAVTTLTECRKAHEEALGRDPARSSWVVLLQYHHAAALREAGKLDEARTLFDQVARSDRPEGWDAALRAGQCHKESGEKKLADGRKQLANPGLRPEQKATAEKLVADGTQELRDAVATFARQEQALRNRKPATEDAEKSLAQVRARLLYEAAWGWRTLAELEIASARLRLQQDRWQKRRDEVARLTPPGQTPPAVAMPEVLLRDVPRQPAEKLVRDRYQELIKSFPDLALNADARFELAEVLAGRDEHDESIKLLQGALEAEKEPSPELTDKLKLRLATCLLDRGSRKTIEGTRKLAQPGIKPADKTAAEQLVEAAKKDVEAALEQLQPVTGNAKSPLLAQAVYREAECQLQLGKLDEAIKLLTRFRDQDPYRNIAGLSDRALLRLGWALGEKKQWEQSRQSYDALLGRFGASPWKHEARYGIGWAFQNQGQYDQAVNMYGEVTAAVATELGARAQLNIGICRLMQKRYADASTALLVVPFTYDYPELSALALVEAARAFTENKQPAQAVKLLKRVLRDHPGSPQAEAAKKRLTELGEEA
jgi:TolA-binding protein